MRFSHISHNSYKCQESCPATLKALLLLVFSCLNNSCKQAPESSVTRAFYYWKSVVTISEPEAALLDTLNTKKLYLRFFDIVKDRNLNQTRPAAKLESQNRFPAHFDDPRWEFVPVVFITNECFVNSDSLAATKLAENTARLLKTMAPLVLPSKAVSHEIQIDCDWTAGTKDNYFHFLRAFRKAYSDDDFRLTATIRLYQCKFLNKTGVPPVDRGMLMCYNMGNLREPSVEVNSILDPDDLRQYTAFLPTYPLSLDIALPLFDWKVLLRDGNYQGLIEGLDDASLQSSLVSKQQRNNFEIVRDTIISGYDLRKGDILRNEQSKTAEVIEAGKHLSRKIRNKDFTLSLYHLDRTIIRKYTKDELEDIFSSMY
ncbi:MAG: hypothetical protein ABW036_14455 [Flavitalea sp.]